MSTGEKKYTDKELLFLGYLSAEAKGDIDEAMKLAGYAPGSKSHVLKTLKMEIIEVASNILASNTIKAAKKVAELLDNPTNPGATTIIKSAQQILDRAGITAQDGLNMKIPQGGIIILPAKGKKIVEEEESEDGET